MGNLQKGVFSRFTRSFVILLLIGFGWYFIGGIIAQASAPGVRNIFETIIDGLPAIAFGSVTALFDLFPHMLIFSIYAAYIHIDDTYLGNLDPEHIYLFRISQNVIGIAAFAVVIYTLFTMLFISVITDRERAGALASEYANFRRLSSWMVTDNTARANKELHAIDTILSTDEKNTIADARFKDVLSMLAVALEQDPLNTTVQRMKMKAYRLRAENTKRKKPGKDYRNRRIRQAVEAAANGAPQEALTILESVLSVDPENREAQFQLADIEAKLKKVKFPYAGRSPEDIHLINTLSNAAQAYGMSNYWRAYEIITNLHDIYPLDADVRKYRSLTLTAINRDDFTIEEARHVERFVMHHTNLGTYNIEKVRTVIAGHRAFRGFAITNINGLDITDPRNISILTNIRGTKIVSINGTPASNAKDFAAFKPFIDELAETASEITFALHESLFPRDVWLSLAGGRLLRIAAIVPFEDKRFAFDVTELTRVRGQMARRTFAYARLFETPFTNGGTATRLLMKGERIGNTPIIDDRRTSEIMIPVPGSVLTDLETSKRRLMYLSLPALYRLYQHAPAVGYASDDIAYTIGKKTITPFWISALIFIMAYLALTYRVSYPRRMHRFHRLVGAIGAFLFSVLGMTFFDIAFNALYDIASLEISIAAIAFSVIVIVSAASFGVARYRFSANE